MNQLELRLLGTVEVWHEGQLLTFPTRKALALLIYLAVTGQRHSREQLTALFWPESDAPRGQASLRNALLRLRRSLGTAESYLQVDDLFISLDSEIFLDVQQVAEATTITDVSLWQAAVRAYGGDFLAGFTLPDTPEFDDWVGTQRQQFHYYLSDILARLSGAQADAGQIAAGIETAVRWTHHDPLNEAAHHCLMKFHLMAEDKATAWQTYQNYHALLSHELGIEPSPKMQALMEQIRAEKQRGRGAEPIAAPPLPRSSTLPLPFVGRSIKHLQLVTAYHAARQGQTQIVVVEGEAGIGKTRLVTEFLHWAAVQGGDVLQGRAFATGGRIPYQPIVDALQPRLERENAPEDLLSDVWLAELSRLLPDLRDRYTDLPMPQGDEATGRTRLMAAITRLGQSLATRHAPVILFIDDLHWADAATLDVLQYSGSAWSQNKLPLLILLAWRDDEPPLTDWLADLKRQMPVLHLALEPLTAADIEQLLVQLGAPDAFRSLAAWLYQQTVGHPFYLVEILKELMTRHVLRWQGDKLEIVGIDEWLAQQAAASFLPDSVRQLIQSRLNGLGVEANRLLTAAAVLGRDSSYQQLCQVAGLEEMAALVGLDELVNGHFFLETAHPSRPYALAHDKIREVVYAGAGAARRQLFHQRAYESLTHSNAPAAELAHHALAAQLTEPAYHHSLSAGDNALRLFAIQDAIVHYQRAKSVAPPSSLASRLSLYTNLGRAYELAGNLPQAAAVYQEMRQQAEQEKQPALFCQALNRLATVAVYAYELDKALSYLQQAKKIASEIADKAVLAETEWTLAQLYHHQFNFQQSLIHSQQTLALARELDNPTLTAGSLNNLAYAHLLLGVVEKGRILMNEARAAYAALGNKALEADCLTAIAAAHFWQGQVQAAVEAAQTAQAICAEIENPWGSMYSRVWLAVALLDRGDYETALAEASAGQAESQQHHLPAMAVFINIILG
jgi:DNA-binding SARP family transcriptional activator/predicted ATPase